LIGGESSSDIFVKLQNLIQEIRKYQLYKKIGYACLPLVFGYYIVKNSKKQIIERTNEISFIQHNIIEEFERIMKDVTYMYRDVEEKNTYLIYPIKANLLKQCLDLGKELQWFEENVDVFSSDFNFFIFNIQQEILILKNKIEDCNKQFIQRRKIEYDGLFRLGLLPLDEDQKTAIITDDKYNLVVAGAGSG